MQSDYVQKIKRWVELDNVVQVQKSKLKVYADEKKSLEDSITDYIQDNDMMNVQIKLSNGLVKFSENYTASSITLKMIKDAIHQYFTEHDECLKHNPNLVEELYASIANKREGKKKVVMKRTITS
jgi:hypothetical protein